MAAIVDDENQLISVGSGKDRVAVNLSKESDDPSQSLLVSSILIEVGDLEIQIRRTAKSKENVSKIPKKSTSLNFQTSEQEKPSTLTPIQWDYSAQYGPHMWSRIFPQIDLKKNQSPIRIYTDQCEYEPDLAQRPFQIDIDENCCQTLENTGRSFQVAGKGYSRITGGPVSDEYQFLQFHMHWGSNELEGSEHVIDGARLPGELHIVTWNASRYQTPQEAAASEKFDGLMVFGILVKITTVDNPELNKLLNLLSKVPFKNDKVSLDFGVVSLRSLFPKDLQNYYTYNGSLTTPMCTESVRWIVFRERMGLSRRQFDQLRQLKCGCQSDTANVPNLTTNFRPVMPLNGRIVQRSFN